MSRRQQIENILFLYGFGVLLCLRAYATGKEYYEDAETINSVLKFHNIPEDSTIEDWISEYWRKGMSGSTALGNLPFYVDKAIEILYTGN